MICPFDGCGYRFRTAYELDVHKMFCKRRGKEDG